MGMKAGIACAIIAPKAIKQGVRWLLVIGLFTWPLAFQLKAEGRAQHKTWSTDISARRENPSLRQPGRTPVLIIASSTFRARVGLVFYGANHYFL